MHRMLSGIFHSQDFHKTSEIFWELDNMKFLSEYKKMSQ